MKHRHVRENPLSRFGELGGVREGWKLAKRQNPVKTLNREASCEAPARAVHRS